MAKQAARLEVFPINDLTLGYEDGSQEQTVLWEVRLIGRNGTNLMHSRQGYGTKGSGSKSNALRAARTINQLTDSPQFPNGRLPILVLDQAGAVTRHIEPKSTAVYTDEDSSMGLSDD